ncbi:acetylornithine deacetylase [Roseovarius phycicola]|uniref:Acetylornithine deacetylase n=1 Tax=Roseovarius phycicola TaxID=3080976 RepID=A0ABZ2HHH7_9RHOB
MTTLDLLRDLIAFPTVSVDPNRALIDYCAERLEAVGADVTIIEDETGLKANLYATVGPRDRPGVMLSGHTDVVPIEGQNWTVPAFEMTEANGRAYGRGTTDMKGFVASALSAALHASNLELQTPLHLAFSYDEELGCLGVHSMIDMLRKAPFRPMFCIVGEPTDMGVATGHKGKTAFRVTCRGKEAHSALAPTGLNAIYLAMDMVSVLRRLQEEIKETSARDEAYDVPYTTVHVAKIEAGGALNIVPNHAEFRFEIRNLSEDDPQELLARIRAEAGAIITPVKDDFPDASIEIEMTNSYPPLATGPDADVVRFVKSLTGGNSTLKVAFGTEGGLFHRELGIPTVICGPGSMAQGHKPDEYVALDQLEKCDAMLAALLERLREGL